MEFLFIKQLSLISFPLIISLLITNYHTLHAQSESKGSPTNSFSDFHFAYRSPRISSTASFSSPSPSLKNPQFRSSCGATIIPSSVAGDLKPSSGAFSANFNDLNYLGCHSDQEYQVLSRVLITPRPLDRKDAGEDHATLWDCCYLDKGFPAEKKTRSW